MFCIEALQDPENQLSISYTASESPDEQDARRKQ